MQLGDLRELGLLATAGKTCQLAFLTSVQQSEKLNA